MKLLLPLLLFAVLPAAPAAGNPIEVGSVNWLRDFDGPLSASAATGKPVFAFFQEVPGCAGCRKFGAEVMTNPSLVKAIENSFIPVLIYNNRPGKDAAILRRYNEPSWNYQVIRFLDKKGKDIIPRRDGVWTTTALATRMIEALEKSKLPVPDDLRKLTATATNIVSSSSTTATSEKESTAAPKLEDAAFSMYCFWTGEMKLGRIDGVIQTEAGWLEGHEVTLVKYDPAKISFDNLVKEAKKHDCANKVYPDPKGYRPASKSDQKKQLQGTPFARLKLTPEQATKVNAFARTDPKKAFSYLTPEQQASYLRN